MLCTDKSNSVHNSTYVPWRYEEYAEVMQPMQQVKDWLVLT